MYSGYPCDNPSTSAMPQMPMQQRLAPRQFGRLRAQDFLNPYASQNSSQHSSPAHSVMSAASGMSIGSAMSVMSRLSISTQISNTFPYHTAPSHENLRPLTADSIPSLYNFIMTYLNAEEDGFWHRMKHKEERGKLFENFWYLTTGRITNSDVKKTGLRHLGEERLSELVKMVFKRLYIDQESYENLGQDRAVWNECIYLLLKNLAMIIQEQDLFEPIIIKMIRSSEVNPVAILYHRIRESQKYTSYAVIAMKAMIFGGSKSRIARFKRVHLKDPNNAKAIVEKLVELVLTNDLNISLKTYSLDLIYHLMRLQYVEVSRIFFCYPDVLRRLLGQCFQLQSDEKLLHKMTHFLQKVGTFKSIKQNETDEINDSFMNHFITTGGFIAVTEMLSHGSPRVLVGCLEFLVLHSHKKWIAELVDFKPTVIAVLKMVCSSEPLIVQRCVWFLRNIVSKNPVLKEVVTVMRGPEMIIQVLCESYPQSYDPTQTMPKLQEIVKDIKANGSQLLVQLLKPDNSQCQVAAKQIVDMPRSPGLFVYWFGSTDQPIDRSTLDMLSVLQHVNQLLPERMREVMQWQNLTRGLADVIVCYIFTAHHYYEHNRNLVDVKNKCFDLILNCCKRDAETAAFVARYIGKTTADEKDNIIGLFAAANDPGMQRDLLKFLASMADSNIPCLRFLPKIWARHRNFDWIMTTFLQSNDPEAARCAQFLMQLSRS